MQLLSNNKRREKNAALPSRVWRRFLRCAGAENGGRRQCGRGQRHDGRPSDFINEPESNESESRQAEMSAVETTAATTSFVSLAFCLLHASEDSVEDEGILTEILHRIRYTSAIRKIK